MYMYEHVRKLYFSHIYFQLSALNIYNERRINLSAGMNYWSLSASVSHIVIKIRLKIKNSCARIKDVSIMISFLKLAIRFIKQSSINEDRDRCREFLINP